jgi:hypothetical protein
MDFVAILDTQPADDEDDLILGAAFRDASARWQLSGGV